MKVKVIEDFEVTHISSDRDGIHIHCVATKVREVERPDEPVPIDDVARKEHDDGSRRGS